ncbi:hypothetical protein AB0J74_24660 [Asanoa sp. NPDC049573]|uniref:hypothetical protein n=1 Tax=Asanoa sp. NPDC049573 TaxID=3155396 RepID=UPI0034288757
MIRELSTHVNTADVAGGGSVGRPVQAPAPLGAPAIRPSVVADPEPAPLLDHFREGVVVTDPAGVIREFSEPALRLMPGLAVGRTLAGCGAPALNTGDLTIGERRVGTPPGDPTRAGVSKKPR